MKNLKDYACNVYSQKGEDGIIEQVLKIIDEIDFWCVEFGAWDAQYMSNTFNLIKSKNYSAILIEADKNKYVDLVKNTKIYPNVSPINAYVGWEGEKKLDAILKKTNIPFNFDILSIDVDGNDYHIWNALDEYRPKIVIIEFNQTIPEHIEFIQKADETINCGSSIRALYNLGKKKKYELICTTDFNAIFVDQKYFELFQIENNDPSKLIIDKKYYTFLYQGFNGQIYIEGCKKMIWHNIPIKESKFQQLPTLFRSYRSNFGLLKKILFKIYLMIR